MQQRSPRLTLAPETPPDGRVAGLFAAIKQALGVPYAGLIVRAYGAYPDFLELFWNSVASATADAQFFVLADRLRASAYTRVYSYFQIPDFCAHAEEMRLSAGARQELTSTVELLYYHTPLQLLLSAAALQAFDRPVGRASQSPKPADHPVFAVRPVLVEESTATPRVKKIYDEIKRALGAPVLNTDFRAFARFPDFLEDYWTALRPLTESALYSESQFGVQDAALLLARDLPVQLSLSKDRLEKAGLDDDDVAAIVRATEICTKMLSFAMLNQAIAKIGFEGGSVRHPEKSTAEAQPPRAA